MHFSGRGTKDEGSIPHSKDPEEYNPTPIKCGYLNPLVDVSLETMKRDRRYTAVTPSEVSMKPLGYGIGNDQDDGNSLGKRSMSIAYSDKERKSLYHQLACPIGNTTYIVQSTDTLAGIAARHNTTPSELVKINKLSSRLIFPGQRLFVPEETEEINSRASSDSSSSQPSPKPGHVERIHSPTGNCVSGIPHQTPSFLAEELDKECLERFLKIKTRYITDGEGVVAGVLIVTPNVLMFDPNVSDPLVIEHGSDKYGVIVPMEMVIRVALYWDIARMALKNAPQPTNISKTDVYHARRPSLIKSTSESEKLSTNEQQTLETCDATHVIQQNVEIPINGENFQLTEVNVSEVAQISEKTYSELPIGTELTNINTLDSLCEKSPFAASPNNNGDGVSKISKSEESIIKTKVEIRDANGSGTHSELSPTQGQEKKLGCENTDLNRVNISHEIDSEHKQLSNISSQSSNNNNNSNNNKNDNNHKKKVHHSCSKVSHTSVSEDDDSEEAADKAMKFCKIGADPGIIVYKNMVENKPDLFKSLEELVPRPAQSSEDSPLYLCIRMGRRINKSLPRSSPIMDYGKMKLKREHWFSIPRDRVDGLYFFFQRWMPDLYGDIDDVNAEDIGFIPITSDEEGEEDNLEEDKAVRDNQCMTTVELSGIVPPEMLEKSDILNEQELLLLCKHLPARAVGYPWTLIYSTSKHGFSLKTLYREMAKYETPVLLVIASTLGDIFGAVISCTLKLSEHFYGTGESFLFTFTPQFKCYPWTGENMYFVKGNPGSLAIGAGDGQFGLWLDDDLYHGRSNECKTFGNETLTKHEDFVVKTLEAWGFV